MTLSPDQASKLETGSAVPITIGKTACILVRQDVFDKLTSSVYDDGDWTDEEINLLAARTFTALDEPEPIT
jgi:hypothetical protein